MGMGKKKRKKSLNKLQPQTESTFLKIKYVDVLIISLIILYSFVIWWTTKNLPYHWDSAGFIINTTRNLVDSNFSPLIPTGSDFAHPPLFMILLGFTWKILGNTILNSHLLMFPFLPLLMISTYFIGKKILNLTIGAVSAFLVGLAPIVVAEYGVVYIDLPMAALTTASIALLFSENILVASLMLSLAVLVKLPAITLLLAFTVYLFKRKNIQRSSFLPLLLPLITLLSWLFYHYQQTGWYLSRPGRLNYMPHTFSQVTQSFAFVVKTLLWDQGRWSLTVIAALSLAILLSRKMLKETITPKVTALLVSLLAGISFYALMGEFGLRYGIFLLPPIAITTVYLVYKIVSQKVFWVIIIIPCIIFLSLWHHKVEPTAIYDFRPPENLAYQDIITIGLQAAHYLQVNFENAEVYGDFPEVYQLTQPYQGYTQKVFNFDYCRNFEYHPSQTQILYLHPYSPGQRYCRQLLDYFQVQPLNRFESNGKWLELYKVETTASANVNPQNSDPYGKKN